MGIRLVRGRRPLTNKTLGPKARLVLQKIITRKISIVSKNFTNKKMLRISFSIEKKIKKRGYKIEGLDLEKFWCFFKFQKIITRSIFVLDKKVYKKKCSEHHFLLKKKLKNPKIEFFFFLEFSKNHNSKNINR